MDTKLVDEVLQNYQNSKTKSDLKAENQALIKEIKKLRDIVDLYTEVKKHRKELVIKPYYSNGIDEVVPIALFSDLHIEKKITRAETNNYNELNPEIAARRVKTYFTNIAKILSKSNVKIPEFVIAMLGDLIHGYIHEEYLSSNYMTPIEATLYAYDVINDGLKIIKDLDFKKVTIICKVGNHSRITKKVYSQSELKHSYEYQLYYLLKQKNPEFDWIIEDNYLTYFKIYNKSIRAHHGHAFGYNGGIGGIFPPMMSWISRQNKTKSADLDIMGHWHTRIWIPDVALINASLCGYDSYQIRRGFKAEPPSQQLIFVDKKRGFTVNYPIIVE